MPFKPSKPFDIDCFVQKLEKAYSSWNPPIITLIASRGASPFEVLISTILSLRTKDEVTAEASLRLFARARTPREMVKIPLDELKHLIYPVGFYPTKAKQILDISRQILDEFDGEVPDEMDALLGFSGVGRKTANLVLIEGFGKEGICVDTHVHRISNRMGYVETNTPEKTEFALRGKLPKRYWVRYNELLVAFGQVLCRPVSPFCSRCPVSGMCARIGVERSR